MLSVRDAQRHTKNMPGIRSSSMVDKKRVYISIRESRRVCQEGRGKSGRFCQHFCWALETVRADTGPEAGERETRRGTEAGQHSALKSSDRTHTPRHRQARRAQPAMTTPP